MKIDLLPYQKRVILSNATIRGIIGGTGTGKTYLLPRWLYISMVTYPNEEWVVSSPTISMLKRNPIKYLVRFFKEQRIDYTYNKTDLVMELKEGIIYFISAENEERMQGLHPKGIFGDEVGLFPIGWWETALQRIAYKGGFIAILTTPYSSNWLKTEVWDKFMQGDPDIYLENPSSWDNPFYPRENIERARERLPEWKFKLLFEGKFTKPAGLIYTHYETVKPFTIPQDWHIILGMDTGYNNPTALVWIAEDPKGNFYVFKEFKQSRVLPDQIYKILEDDKDKIIYADPANQEVLHILKRMGLRIRDAKKDVLAGITHVQGLFEKGKLKVFSDCVKLIDELDSYMWEQDKTGDFIDKPVKYNDHLVDALRYALFTYSSSSACGVRFV